MATLESDSSPNGANRERSTSGSMESSSSWSDVEGDEYLAKALAADNYLRGDSAKAGMPLNDDGLARGVLKDSIKNLEARGQHSRSDTIVLHHPACELHEIPGHPERPGRVRAIMNALMRNFPDTRAMLAPEAEIEQVLRFHCRPHVDEILRLCSESEKRYRAAEAKTDAAETAATKGGGRRGTRSNTRVNRARDGLQQAGIVRIDSDTAVMPASREAILRAAGAACFAVDEVMSGRARNAFCCVRPPGHHAEPDAAMGFCFFNNAPIGALHAQAEHGIERVAVVDIDVHHGNGTQAAFAKNPTTFYASTHQGPFFYPGTGFDDEKGVASNVVNTNMEYGEGSRDFRRAYSEKILPALEAFRPGLIVISAGFDAHKDDPLAGITLDEDDYGWVTNEICAVASRVCGGRVVSILEGGYNLQAISDSAVEHVRALREAASAANAKSSDPLSADGLKVVDSVRCRMKGRLRSGGRGGKAEREQSEDVDTASPSNASMEESPPCANAPNTADFNLTEALSGPPSLADDGGRLSKAETKMSADVIRVKQRDRGCPGDGLSGGRSDDTVKVDWDVTRELDPDEVEEVDGLIGQLSLVDDECS